MLTGSQLAHPLQTLRPLAGRVWYEWRSGSDRRHAVRLLCEAVRALPPQPGLPSPADWSVDRVVPTETDVTVAIFGAAGTGAVAIGRLAAAGELDPGLDRNAAAVTRLLADPRLADLHALLPTPIGSGRHGGRAYAVERAIPGRPATALLDRPDSVARILSAATAAIGGLHSVTAEQVTVDDGLIDRWFGRQLDVVAAAGSRRDGPEEARVARLRQELTAAFEGRTCFLASTHGDYWLGNLLVDPHGEEVRGIVDWDAFSSEGLPLVDLLHLQLTSRGLAENVDFGLVVAQLLDAGRWTPEDRRMLEPAGWSLPDWEVSVRQLVLLTWLHHVSAVLAKRPAYASNRRWMTRNVETVLSRM